MLTECRSQAVGHSFGWPRVAAAVCGVAVLLVVADAWAGGSSTPGDPVARVALLLALVLVSAKVGGDAAVRVGQPAVLGEIVAGIVLGNAVHCGVGWFEVVRTDATLDMLARLGVLVLLFQVGLESTVGQMMRVGWSALLVASLGVVAPLGLGWGVSAWLLPDASPYAHVFLGATLCATSVGITARVLSDLGRVRSNEARIILGAAVIDDVLGLVVLSIVTGMITAADSGTTMSASSVVATVGKAAAFLVGALLIGIRLSPRVFLRASHLRSGGVLLGVGLAFCFVFAWIADQIGLAPIVGAFAAGLVLEQAHYQPFLVRGEHGMEELIRPVAEFLVPVFFVLAGVHTDLRVFANPTILTLAGALTVAAVVGKQACSLGILGKGVDRLSVGIGMIPRGEVGLIFANAGLGLKVGGQPIIDSATFSSVIVTVVLTTILTPPALKWSLNRRVAVGQVGS